MGGRNTLQLPKVDVVQHTVAQRRKKINTSYASRKVDMMTLLGYHLHQ